SEGHGRRKSRRVLIGYKFAVCTGRRRPRGFDSNVARNRSSHRKLKPRGDRDEDRLSGLSGRSRKSRDQIRIGRQSLRQGAKIKRQSSPTRFGKQSRLVLAR
ncbi:hypothetical protein PpBr36_05152, partial [Pyricularia pennisetigena]|uniref:hypothetical protein n=1 Tax=Pyricularia pennisetigena TaxID=1578925 RepID=UPI001151862F